MRFRLLCAAAVLAFAVIEWRGVALWPASEHVKEPLAEPGARGRLGGHSSYWHRGYQGGK